MSTSSLSAHRHLNELLIGMDSPVEAVGRSSTEGTRGTRELSARTLRSPVMAAVESLPAPSAFFTVSSLDKNDTH
jgi:hypothetical protein